MLKVILIASLGAGLLSASEAEAAKMRIGGGKRTTATQAASPGLVVAPSLRSGRGNAAAAEPARVPFPPATAAPAFVSLNTREAKRPWCQSEIVVGGFCVLN